MPMVAHLLEGATVHQNTRVKKDKDAEGTVRPVPSGFGVLWIPNLRNGTEKSSTYSFLCLCLLFGTYHLLPRLLFSHAAIRHSCCPKVRCTRSAWAMKSVASDLFRRREVPAISTPLFLGTFLLHNPMIFRRDPGTRGCGLGRAARL